MNAIDLLIGKKVKVMTDMKVEVELEIQEVKNTTTSHTRQITPDTPENDWWGETETTHNVSYTVTFTNGSTKKYHSLESINVI